MSRPRPARRRRGDRMTPPAPSTADVHGIAGLSDRLDEQLAAADAALAEHYPGDRACASRSTRLRPGRPLHRLDRADWGAEALAALDAHGATPERSPKRAGMPVDARPSTVYPLVRRKLETRADRGPAHRLRGRLRPPLRRRGGRGRRRRGRCPAPTRSKPERPRRSTGSASSRSRRPPAGAGCAPSTGSSGSWSSAAACTDGFLLTLPKVTSVDQVRPWSTACDWLEDTHGLADRAARLRDPGRDPAGHPRVRRVARLVAADDPRRRRTMHRPSLRHLRLLRVDRRRRGSTRAWSTRSPTTPRRSCRSRRPAPGCSLSDGSTNVLPAGDAAAVAPRLDACTRGSSAGRSNAATTRAGTCTRPSCPPGTRPPTRSTATGSPARSARLRAYLGCSRTRSSSTNRPPPSRSPGSSCAGSTAAPSSEAELAAGIGVDRSRLAQLARRRARLSPDPSASRGALAEPRQTNGGLPCPAPPRPRPRSIRSTRPCRSRRCSSTGSARPQHVCGRRRRAAHRRHRAQAQPARPDLPRLGRPVHVRVWPPSCRPSGSGRSAPGSPSSRARRSPPSRPCWRSAPGRWRHGRPAGHPRRADARRGHRLPHRPGLHPAAPLLPRGRDRDGHHRHRDLAATRGHPVGRWRHARRDADLR